MGDSFLHEPPQRNFPSEYFIARIRGKRQYLIKDWEDFIYSPEPWVPLKASGYGEAPVWRTLSRRYRWLYSEMNEQLRDLFWPYFGWYEMRAFFISVRFLRQGLRQRATSVMKEALLSEELKEILLSERDFGDCIKGIAGFFCRFHEGFLKGHELFLEGGLREFEAFMNERLLEYLFFISKSDLMKGFFSYLIDMRNIMNLYRSIKWGIPFRDFVSGGIMDKRLFDKLRRESDLAVILDTIKRLSGLSEENPEDAFLKGLSLKLKKLSYGPDGTGLILYYLWSLYIECRNLSTILETKGLEKARLTEELL